MLNKLSLASWGILTALCWIFLPSHYASATIESIAQDSKKVPIDFSWPLTEDGRYVIQVNELNGKLEVFIKNSSNTWSTTSLRLKAEFKAGLRVKIDGKTIVPDLLEGPLSKGNGIGLNAKKIEFSMFDKVLAGFENKSGVITAVSEQRPLSIYDIRQFSSNAKYSEIFNPVKTIKNKPLFVTDLHTHLAGHVEVEDLMHIGYNNNVAYPTRLLDQIGVKYPQNAIVNGNIKFKSLLSSQEFKTSNGYARLEDAMMIESSHVRTFMDMESKYLFRGPITKDPNAFREMLWSVGKSSGKSGVKYTEQSVSSILDPELLRVAEKELPLIERQTGVKIRFLVGLWRHSDPEWNLDEITRVKRLARSSPYIVGVDFMGHETNSSAELADQIKAADRLKGEFGPEFQVRVHAGENPLDPSNVRVASELGATRVGHGLYIEKDLAALKLDPKTQKIAPNVLEKLKKAGTIIEINPTSNQALNNLSGGTDVVFKQFKQFRDAGIPVVVGTDGIGMYGADHLEVARVLEQLGFSPQDIAYLQASEQKYLASAERAFRARAATRNPLPTQSELNNFVKTEGAHYSQELGNKRTAERAARLKQMETNFAQKGIKSFDANSSEFQGMRAIDVSGGSASQFKTLAAEGRMSELQIPAVRKNFQELLAKLDPKKAFFLDGGTQFGVEAILHEEVAKFNSLHPNSTFKIVGVLPEVAEASEVFGPAQSGITHYQLRGKGWADFGLHKLELLESHGGIKIGIAGKMFVADEFRSVINANLPIQVFYQDGPIGASTDLARERPEGAYKNIDELFGKMGASVKDYVHTPPVPPMVKNIEIISAMEKLKPVRTTFIKDAPTLAYQIKSSRFEDIPLEIRKHLGTIDQTKYTPEYLRKNIGSAIALQMNGDKPDFYIIGKETFDSKYRPVQMTDVSVKNSKYFNKISEHLPNVIHSTDQKLVAVLKTTPTEMVKMSALGHPIDEKVTIQSPWGEQTKPAGKDAYLVWDDSQKQYYMVNAADDGRPLSYVDTKSVASVENRTLTIKKDNLISRIKNKSRNCTMWIIRKLAGK